MTITGRRAAAAALTLGILGGVLLTAGGGGSGADGYKVRAIFDNASFVIPGEDVKVAGVTVGSIDSLDVTGDQKAAVVLRIDDPAFQAFRTDAHCRVALQSLIGEQFVECEPTRPRAAGNRPPPELERIPAGRGKGQYLLPVENTSSPVGVDLLNNIMRLPQRDRFRIIVSELGAGLASNGPGLRAALRRSSPALQETDRVIATLAGQDRLLARLVDESDQVLSSMAHRRKRLTGFIDGAGKTAEATAERGDDLERNFEWFPAFLRQLKPAADRLTGLADEVTPALETLDSKAAAINQTVQRFGPFTRQATPALVTLGDFADRGRRVFPAIEPLAEDLGDLARPLKPLARDLADLSGSFDRGGGVEDVMRFIYFYTGAVNGEDAIGHYIRSGVNIVGNCAARISEPVAGCESTFDKSGETGTDAAAANARGTDAPMLDFLLGGDEQDGAP